MPAKPPYITPWALNGMSNLEWRTVRKVVRGEDLTAAETRILNAMNIDIAEASRRFIAHYEQRTAARSNKSSTTVPRTFTAGGGAPQD